MLLRDALAGSPDDTGRIQSATLTVVNSDGTVTVDLGAGRTVERCPVLGWYTPASGDAVQVVWRDASSLLVIGPVRTSNPTTVDVGTALAFPFNVTPKAPAVANPLIVPAAAIRSWRNNEGWSGAAESNNAAQGAYSSTWGYYRGCYFYGAGAFSALEGRTCTGLTIRLHRTGSGGIAGAERVWLAPHAHESVPSSAPYFTEGARNVTSIAWNQTVEVALPTWWGQALIDGTAKGIGHLYLGTADYAVFHGLGADSLSGRLTLTWS